MNKQKRLDSPDREKFLVDLRLLEERKTSPKWIATKYLALFPNIDQAIQATLTAYESTCEALIEEARREEGERIFAELDARALVILQRNGNIPSLEDWQALNPVDKYTPLWHHTLRSK